METFSALLAPRDWNPPATGGFSHKVDVFLSAPEQTVDQTIETPVIWDAIALIMTSL